ncbi:MAG TPA: hypothetical protein VKZ61_09765, partial [Thermomicrobiales bacterium]|nr:hypothetical protein [Thermomicrobiales bacterium]
HAEETGYLVTTDDPKEWSCQIIRVAQDESSARVVGQNARSFVKRQLGWSRIAAKTAELYKSVSTR